MTTMYDPVHPGESLRDAMDAEKWTVTEAAAKLGCTRQTFSRLLTTRPHRHIASDGAGVRTASGGVMPRSGCGGRRSTNSHRERLRQKRTAA